MTRTVAMDLRRHGTPTLGAADKAWLEGQPQSLWALLDTAVATSTAGRRDGVLITASRWLLANQLELIRASRSVRARPPLPTHSAAGLLCPSAAVTWMLPRKRMT